ncbi:MAG: hypothetical protein JST00_15700 [Deltaproteobacteria bacterium]|nr:hypothetical protein [Deltaproteobacteria bacterium]
MARPRSLGSLLALVAFGAAALFACSSESAPGGSPPVVTDDGSAPPADDGGVTTPPDSGPATDAGTDAPPAACTPAGGDILGTLASGVCCQLKQKLAAKTPSIDENLLVFTAGEAYDRASLSPGGQTIFDTPNAGGSSTESEVMSFEVLRYCEGATLVKTETQVTYDPPAGPITDILVAIDGQRVGVSVTRAYKPPSQTLTDADVKDLLEKKLDGINKSSARVVAADKWVKQILHVFSVDKAATDAVKRVYATIDPALRADTIVLVTQTKGGGFVYCNPDPALGTECP